MNVNIKLGEKNKLEKHFFLKKTYLNLVVAFIHILKFK